MKNLVAILLMTVHLFAYTDIIQVFRFPNLVQHYQEHHARNKSIGVIDFLLMHYGKCDDGISSDDKEDMQLPFKTIDFHIITHAIIVTHEINISKSPVTIFQNTYYSQYNGLILSTLSTDLLRPPIFSA